MKLTIFRVTFSHALATAATRGQSRNQSRSFQNAQISSPAFGNNSFPSNTPAIVATAGELATEAGFSHFRRLDFPQNPFNLFYEIRV